MGFNANNCGLHDSCACMLRSCSTPRTCLVPFYSSPGQLEGQHSWCSWYSFNTSFGMCLKRKNECIVSHLGRTRLRNRESGYMRSLCHPVQHLASVTQYGEISREERRSAAVLAGAYAQGMAAECLEYNTQKHMSEVPPSKEESSVLYSLWRPITRVTPLSVH